MQSPLYTINRQHRRSNLVSAIFGKLSRPLRVTTIFRDQPYRLGGMIHVDVHLEPGRDVNVTEGRVELVCEEHYTETYTTMVPDHRAARAGMGNTAAATPYPTATFLHRETEQRVEGFVHSGTVFATNARLRSGVPQRYRVRLAIAPEPPTHAGLGAARWTLITTLRLPRGREIVEERAVTIRLA